MNTRIMKRKPAYIVVHNTVIPLSLSDQRHLEILLDCTRKRHGNQFGGDYQKVVLPSGHIQNLVPIGKYAPHIDFNDGENDITNDNAIGIAVSFNGSIEEPTELQMAKLINEVAWMCKYYQIPVENVKKHSEINPTSCPGILFPWEQLISGVEKTLNINPQERVFKDVEVGRWSNGVIRYCKDKDIMGGDGDGYFRPGDPLTREEMAAVAVNIITYLRSEK